MSARSTGCFGATPALRTRHYRTSWTSELNGAVKEVHVWVPVSHLHVQSPFSIADVEFRMWEPDVFDGWIRAAPPGLPRGQGEGKYFSNV